jgi:hypothetical protein
MRSKIPLVFLATVAVCGILAGASPSAAQQLDWAMLACDIAPGPGPGELTLHLTMALLESPGPGEFQADVGILFNGSLIEVPHPIVAFPGVPGPCPQVAGCPDPVPACNHTGYLYKNVIWADAWDCLFNGGTGNCDCVGPGVPVPHDKVISAPSSPPPNSFFDVFVDVGNLVPETNEDNNDCRIPYAPTATEDRSWGRVKVGYR